MLDFGWLELILIIALVVIVIGPNEIPVVMVALGRVFRRFQYIKFAISQQFDDVMQTADLDDIRKSVNFEDRDDFDEAEADAEYIAEVESSEDAPTGEGDDKDDA